MSTIDAVKLLEKRTQKAAALITILRKQQTALKQELAEERAKPAFDPETEAKLKESEAENQSLKTENEELRKEVFQKVEESALFEVQLDEAVTKQQELARQLADKAELEDRTEEIDNLKRQLEELTSNFEKLENNYNLVLNHNAELEDYVESYETSNKLIEESVSKAMETLDSIDGLDDIPLEPESFDELAVADDFTSGGALTGETVDEVPLEDLLLD